MQEWTAGAKLNRVHGCAGGRYYYGAVAQMRGSNRYYGHSLYFLTKQVLMIAIINRKIKKRTGVGHGRGPYGEHGGERV